MKYLQREMENIITDAYLIYIYWITLTITDFHR